MAKTDYQSIDEYLATVDAPIRERLQAIRAVIRRAIPDAQEGIGYQIPVFTQDGPVIYFSAYARHIAISSPPPTIEHFAAKLTEYKTSKSQFQLPHDAEIPEELIAEIATWRVGYNAEQAAKKRAAKKK